MRSGRALPTLVITFLIFAGSPATASSCKCEGWCTVQPCWLAPMSYEYTNQIYYTHDFSNPWVLDWGWFWWLANLGTEELLVQVGKEKEVCETDKKVLQYATHVLKKKCDGTISAVVCRFEP